MPETLVAPIEELERAYFARATTPAFRAELVRLLAHYVGRPTPLYEARRLSRGACGARIFLKREDLAHTGAHKINNALGQALLAKRMGKTRDRRRDRRRTARRRDRDRLRAARPRVRRLHGRRGHGAPGAERRSACGCSARRSRGVDAGSRTLKDAINEAMRDWVANVGDTLLPARLGARPASVSADGARVPVGDRPRGARSRCSRRPAACPTPWSPASAAAATPSASSTRFIDDAGVRLIGVEAGGERHRAGPSRGAVRRRQPGRAAGHAHLRPAGRGRQHRADALGLGRPRLRRGRARARVAARARDAPSIAWADDAAALAAFQLLAQHGRHPARARIVARVRRAATRGAAELDADADRDRQSVGPRRQGRPHRRAAGCRALATGAAP